MIVYKHGYKLFRKKKVKKEIPYNEGILKGIGSSVVCGYNSPIMEGWVSR